MSATPSRGRRSLDDEALLAVARTLPEPTLSESRREEMRTAFLSTVRGLRGGQRSRALATRTRRRRILLIGALLFAGASAAAAAWRIRNGETRSRLAGPPSAAGLAHRLGPRSPEPAPPPTLPEPEPDRRIPVEHPSKVSLSTRGARSASAPEVGVEISFARGWSALRSGDFNTAAEAFERVSSKGRDSALAQDASFWRGVALDRAGHFAAARAVLADFLAAHPDSDRKGEASVILGWLLVRAGELGPAQERFEAALHDPAERVSNSARAGLAATAQRRTTDPR